MRNVLFTAVCAFGLIACSADAGSGSHTDKVVTALASELPVLSGNDVWTLVPKDSTVSFEAFYNGKLTGSFKHFQTAIRLDPQAPGTGEIHAIVDLASVSVKDDDVKANLPLTDWFDVANHPYARFSSKTISALEGGNFMAKGDLTLKGVTQPASLNFSLNIDGDTAHALGGLEISRTDFNVGSSSDFQTEDWVRFPVSIKVDIKATQ